MSEELKNGLNGNAGFPEEDALPTIRTAIPYDDEEEEEEPDTVSEFKSQRVAVANFNTRPDVLARRQHEAELALADEKQRRRDESKSGVKRILLSFAVGIAVLVSLWLFVQSRTHRKNDASSHEVHFYYNISEQNTIIITAADSLNVNLLEVPEKMNGKDVTCIGANAFAGHFDLETVHFPDTITEIGYNAFKDCESIVDITIPDSVETIGYCAFFGCTHLKSIHLPASLKTVEYGTFGECFQLGSIEIPQGVTSIDHGAFQSCTRLRQITLPDTLQKIGYDAFRSCGVLQSVELPDSVTEIGTSAFSGCSSLKSVTVPRGVTTLVSYTFKDCAALEEVHIHEGVTSISENTFQNSPHVTIYGAAGSFAEKFAQDYGIPFAVEEQQEEQP